MSGTADTHAARDHARAQAGDRPCVITADCDRASLERARSSLPALRHRRLA